MRREPSSSASNPPFNDFSTSPAILRKPFTAFKGFDCSPSQHTVIAGSRLERFYRYIVSSSGERYTLSRRCANNHGCQARCSRSAWGQVRTIQARSSWSVFRRNLPFDSLNLHFSQANLQSARCALRTLLDQQQLTLYCRVPLSYDS